MPTSSLVWKHTGVDGPDAHILQTQMLQVEVSVDNEHARAGSVAWPRVPAHSPAAVL